MHNPSYRHLPDDLGLEPPLTAEGAVVETIVLHRLNVRWLAGIILTGLAGSALMLFSVVGALTPTNNIVSVPQLTKGRDDRNISGALVIVARKGDKLIRKANLIAARQDYKAPVLVKAGAAEVTRQAGFTRLASPLATETLGFAEQVPAYNLAKLVSMASEDRAATEGEIGTSQDTEVALSSR